MQLFLGVAMANRRRGSGNAEEPPNSRPRVSDHEEFILGGGQHSLQTCINCFCDPCIADPLSTPSFIRGSACPHPNNVAK